MSLDYLNITDFITDPDWRGNTYFNANSPDGRYLLSSPYRSLMTLDRSTETVTTAFDPDTDDDYHGSAIDNSGNLYFLLTGTGLVKITNFGNGTKTTLQPYAGGFVLGRAESMRLFVMPDATLRLAWIGDGGFEAADCFIYNVNTNSLTTVSNPATDAWENMFLVQDTVGDIWGVGPDENGTSLHFCRFLSGGASTAAPNHFEKTLLPALSSTYCEALHTPSGWFVSWSGGTDLYLLATSNFAQTVHRAYAAEPLQYEARQKPFLMHLAHGATSFWFLGRNSVETLGGPWYVDVEKIQASDLTTLETRELFVDWTPGDNIYPGSLTYTTYGRIALASFDGGGDGFLTLRYFPDDSGGGGGGGESESRRLRVWGYSLDDHNKYVLRVGEAETFIYDLSTGQWAQFSSPDRDNWRAHVGQNWIGMSVTTFAHGFGTDIVAGDDTENVLWILDPTYGKDDRPTTGSDPFTRIVTGGISVSGRNTIPCGAVQLACSVGAPIQDGATIVLETSDDFGQTWLNHGAVTLTTDDFGSVVEWRALGQITQPGRVFRITDTGATVRIAAADMR